MSVLSVVSVVLLVDLGTNLGALCAVFRLLWFSLSCYLRIFVNVPLRLFSSESGWQAERFSYALELSSLFF